MKLRNGKSFPYICLGNGWGSLMGYGPWDCKESDTTEWLNTHKWRPTTSSRTNTKKGCPFHHSGLECKSRKSRGTQNNRQVWLWSMKWSRAKTSRVLLREHTAHSKHSFPTTQEVILHRDITRWSIPKSDWLSSFQPKMKKLYTISKNKTWSWLWLRSWAL